VLGNLVHNAADACADSRGTIRVSGGFVAAAAVPSAHRFPVDWHPTADTYAYVEVADTGRGIPAGEIDTIFDPFYTTKFVGRGLGLSVALGIVRAHDGVITVESEVGRGSVFRVYLPAEPAAPSFVGLADAASETQAARGSVLLVDDEPGVRKTVARALRRAGFTVLEAADGAAALELFRAHQSDLACVLCDVTMPRMDGWQTLTELRRLAPGFPVILASGYGEAQVMEGEHLELPMAFLSKPFQADLLAHTLDRLISERE
jgi:CheY-like chemotaxis protein